MSTYLRDLLIIHHDMMLTSFFLCSNATIGALNQTQDYFGVLEEVTKYNIHLNYGEKLWAVRLPALPTAPLDPSLRNKKANMHSRPGTFGCKTIPSRLAS